MTLSTSAVAVCCWSDSRSSLSRRVFSMAMTAWFGEVLQQVDLLIGKWPHFLAINGDVPINSFSLIIGTRRPSAGPASSTMQRDAHAEAVGRRQYLRI